ncbi:hypothetical protein [Hymenobacter sp.]|uniref:hypothetical protein n=1 Tax=Hymenobacter sp. TaxID=1898978 RepID=UPI00286B00DE|nr:hypothetical protein [Hymenobacter sp.]
MAPLTFLRLAGLFLALLALPQLAHGQVTLKELRSLWTQRQYQQVALLLKEYRKQPYGRNLEVDYMIATSWCQLQREQSLVTRRFAWMLQHYSMSKPMRRTIEVEHSKCTAALSAAAGPDPVTYNIIFSSIRSTGGYAGGKTFYQFNFNNATVVSEPAQIVAEIAEEEFEQRKILASRQDSALGPFQRALATSRTVGNKPVNYCQDVYRGSCNTARTEHFLLTGGSDHPQAALERIGAELESYLRFYRRAYRMETPPQFLTVYVAASADQLRRIAEIQHGIRITDGAIGYSFQNDLSLAAAVPYAGQGTLQHELFHLLARVNFGDIPPWLDEGMAALYEVSATGPAGIRGLPNWRGRVLYEFGAHPVLNRPWKALSGSLKGEPDLALKRTIAELMAMPWDQFDGYAENLSPTEEHGPKGALTLQEQAYNHALARYFALFLQEKGCLPAVYQKFRQQEPDLEQTLGSSEQLLAAAVGKPLPRIEKEFNQWLAATVEKQRQVGWESTTPAQGAGNSSNMGNRRP